MKLVQPNQAIKKNKKSKPSLQQQFQETWQAIQKIELRLKKQNEKRQIIFQQFNAQIRPLEEEQYQLTFAQVERLISFYEKKSLTAGLRDDLFQWIMSEFDFLEQHPFRPADLDVEALYTRFHQQAMDRSTREMFEGPDGSFDTAREMFYDQFGTDFGFTDEELYDCLRDPEKFQAHFEQFDRSAVPDEEETIHKFGDDSESDPFSDPFEDEIVIEPMHTQILTEAGLKGLYKKLALRLHPDRAQDDKADSAEQMVRLSKAWKQQDVYTLLTMATEFLPSDEFGLTDEQIKALLPLLNKQQSDLQFALFDNHGLEWMIYQKFHGRTDKVTERNFREHEQFLHRQIEELKSFLEMITTLKSCKTVLQQRREQRFAEWDVMNDFDFFN